MANRLIEEQSPYLLQHAHNPVDWHPWGDEPFEKATLQHKPVIVSIGYAACHWCHVMEHESFENEQTAAYMNEHFICIKVDREEHPDVDHLYMDAVQAIAGNGGWPLNVFVTPGRMPFYGGTYYPPRPAYNRPSWMQLLQRMNEIWHQQPHEVAAQAEQLVKHLQAASLKGSSEAVTLSADMCRQIADNLLKQADKEKGGFGAAPKFPGTMAISFLLEHYHFTKHEPSLQQALLSLDAMIAGGIYDQLGGGFARYSTDREWLAPHFEKMLYDNALLISTLCDAYRITHEARYRNVIIETIAFAERELKDESGGYYCALDADSEGEEGKFYTWTWEEWTAVAGDDTIAQKYFGVKQEGNWEGTNILHIAMPIEGVAEENGMPVNEAVNHINKVKQKLLAARAERVRPMTDDKSLLSWNALMNIALSKAAVALRSGSTEDRDLADQYAHRAVAHMQWMLSGFDNDGLKHAWKKGQAKIPAKLDDYAYLIQALLQLATIDGPAQWLLKAASLTEIVLHEFSGDDLFYYTSELQRDIPVRKVDSYDGATPSCNAMMAHNLWICGMCMERPDWIDRSGRMLQAMAGVTTRYSYSFGYWATLIQRHMAGQKTMILAGDGAKTAQEGMQTTYLPHIYSLTLEKEISDVPIFRDKLSDGKMSIFVCSEEACLSPVSTVDEALHLAKGS